MGKEPVDGLAVAPDGCDTVDISNRTREADVGRFQMRGIAIRRPGAVLVRGDPWMAGRRTGN